MRDCLVVKILASVCRDLNTRSICVGTCVSCQCLGRLGEVGGVCVGGWRCVYVHNRAANRPIRDERVWMEPIKDEPSRRLLPHRQQQPGTGAEEDELPPPSLPHPSPPHSNMDKEHLHTHIRITISFIELACPGVCFEWDDRADVNKERFKGSVREAERK